MSIASFLLDLIGSGMSAHPTAPTAATAADAIVTAGPAVLTAIEHVAMGQATAADAETIVEAILDGVVIVDPALAPVVKLAVNLAPIAEVLIASGMVRPGEAGDGQTAATTETNGRYIGR